MRVSVSGDFYFLSVMLSEALQRNAKHKARLSNISGCPSIALVQRNKSEIESLASPRKLSGLRCSFASLRMTERLSPSSAAAEDSAKQAASDLPAD